MPDIAETQLIEGGWVDGRAGQAGGPLESKRQPRGVAVVPRQRRYRPRRFAAAERLAFAHLEIAAIRAAWSIVIVIVVVIVAVIVMVMPLHASPRSDGYS